jgi:hypothetical protein
MTESSSTIDGTLATSISMNGHSLGSVHVGVSNCGGPNIDSARSGRGIIESTKKTIVSQN